MLRRHQTLLPPFHDAASTGDRVETLFRRVTDDDYAAFESIFKDSYRFLCAYSRHLVACPQLAEEIVDDVFFNLWQNRKKIHITISFRAYLITCIRNRSLDSLRKGKGVKTYVLDHAESVECKQSIACDTMAYEELRTQIDRAIQGLPEQCRVIFRMSRDEELSYKDIASQLHISVKTVDTQIGRALKHIRRRIAIHDQK